MTPQEEQETNRIIAEFRWESEYNLKADLIKASIANKTFTRSLDSQAPVWEKLGIEPEFKKYKSGWQCNFWVGSGKPIINNGNSRGDMTEIIQQAAALATAKAIRELRSQKGAK